MMSFRYCYSSVIRQLKVNDKEKTEYWKQVLIFTHDTSKPISSFGNVPVTRNQNLSAGVVICPGVFPVKIKISSGKNWKWDCQRLTINLETALRQPTSRYNYTHKNGLECTSVCYPLCIKTTNYVNFGTRPYDDLGLRARGRPKTLCRSQEPMRYSELWRYKCCNFILIQA